MKKAKGMMIFLLVVAVCTYGLTLRINRLENEVHQYEADLAINNK